MRLPFINIKKNRIKPTVLVIIDGFGSAPPSEGNAISVAKTPNYDKFITEYPVSELIASGESVGLPANEEGNTEVGHLTLGAGRVILQDLKRISVSIEKGLFFNNQALLQATSHIKSNSSNLHIMGLIGTGHVHSSIDHLYGLLDFCKREEIKNVYLHLFTDGRDSPPKEGRQIIEEVENHLKAIKLGRIVSVTGRYYAMDRDRRWERTERAYKAIALGQGVSAESAIAAVEGAYLKGQTDEFIEPTVIGSTSGKAVTVNDNDAVIFFNFRIDRPKQLTMAFVLSDFENLKSYDFGYEPDVVKEEGEVKFGTTFTRSKVARNVFFVTMTEYQKGLPVSKVAFGPEVVEKPLSQVLAESGFRQLHIAESEKERFVKYYFNGLREEPVEGEDDLIVPSPKVATYDRKPEMSLPKLVKMLKKQLEKDIYNFVVVNFANPDMVAHTGNLKATVKAIEHVDKHLKSLVDKVLASDGTVLITADHGNAEELLTFPTSGYFFTTSKGTLNTDHSNNPVPLLIINNSLRNSSIKPPKGALSDIAPTILGLFGIQKPAQMTGNNLLEGFVSNSKAQVINQTVNSNTVD
jgi:2,3-bisphosphoglycerate-independent phosphoglycerate mutase